MHELGIVVKVLEQVDEAAAKHGARKVLKVTMETGEVSGIVPSLFKDAFDWAKKKTRTIFRIFTNINTTGCLITLLLRPNRQNGERSACRAY